MFINWIVITIIVGSKWSQRIPYEDFCEKNMSLCERRNSNLFEGELLRERRRGIMNRILDVFWMSKVSAQLINPMVCSAFQHCSIWVKGNRLRAVPFQIISVHLNGDHSLLGLRELPSSMCSKIVERTEHNNVHRLSANYKDTTVNYNIDKADCSFQRSLYSIRIFSLWTNINFKLLSDYWRCFRGDFYQVFR